MVLPQVLPGLAVIKLAYTLENPVAHGAGAYTRIDRCVGILVVALVRFEPGLQCETSFFPLPQRCV